MSSTAMHNNKNDTDHSKDDIPLNKTPKHHKNVSLVAETGTYEANEFPRAASNALLEEQNSDEDNSDFSVEREILKKQLKKCQERKTDSDGHVKQCEIHKNSESSMLDACEDCDEDEDRILRALEEIDGTKKAD